MTPSQIASIVAAIVGQFEAVEPEIIAATGTNTTLAADIKTGLEAVKTAASALATAEGQPAADLMSRIETDLNAVLGSLATLPLSPKVALYMQLAQMWLPILVASAKLMIPKL